MIRGLRDETSLTYSQTLNGQIFHLFMVLLACFLSISKEKLGFLGL